MLFLIKLVKIEYTFFLLLVSEVEIHINLENKRGEWVMGIEWLVSRVLDSGWVADGCGWVCRCG